MAAYYSSSSSSSSQSAAPRNVRIVVTANEQGHVNYDLAAALSSQSGLDAEVAQLDVADYALVRGERGAPLAQCEVLALFERKTYSDFDTSIPDGRYHDQVARLLASTAPFCYFYVVESQLFRMEHIGRVRKAISHLRSTGSKDAAKEGRVFGVIESVEREPLGLAMELGRLACYVADAESTLTVATAMKMGGRRKMRAQRDVWKAQLMCIDGVSAEKAAALMKEVPSAAALLRRWEQSKSGGVVVKKEDAAPAASRKRKKKQTEAYEPADLALEDVVVNEKKGRRIGPALSKCIRVAMTEEAAETLDGKK